MNFAKAATQINIYTLMEAEKDVYLYTFPSYT